jgi:hypothetical protein
MFFLPPAIFLEGCFLAADVFSSIWSTLDVEGWVTDEGLPKGWRIRSKDRLKDSWQFYFLSPQMETFKSNKAVLDFIRYGY